MPSGLFKEYFIRNYTAVFTRPFMTPSLVTWLKPQVRGPRAAKAGATGRRGRATSANTFAKTTFKNGVAEFIFVKNTTALDV